MLLIPNSKKTIPQWLPIVARSVSTVITNLAPLWSDPNADRQEWIFAGITDVNHFDDFNEAVLGVLKCFKDVDIILVCDKAPPKSLFGVPGIKSTKTVKMFNSKGEFGDIDEILSDLPDSTEWCWEEVEYLRNAACNIESSAHITYHVMVHGTPLKILAIVPPVHLRADTIESFVRSASESVDLSPEEISGCIARLVTGIETIQLTSISNVRLFIDGTGQLILEARCNVKAKNTPHPHHDQVDYHPKVEVILTTQYATFATHMGHPVGAPTAELANMLSEGLDVYFLENQTEDSIKVWFVKKGSPEGTPPVRMTLKSKYKNDKTKS